MTNRIPLLILGAGGRDFHVFNTCYRNDSRYRVVAITAAQIPNIEHRTYPAVLAGPLYPNGIPIRPESDLEAIVREYGVKEVVFAYSDVTLEYLEAMGRRVTALGPEFHPFDVERTMLRSTKPVVAVCAVRTGCGKSGVSRHVAQTLRDLGKRVAVLRHPMPYGDLSLQIVQRFATLADLDRHHCTIEEMEEYEPHIAAGNVVFAGADYAKILAAAETEADVILWDGGNNDTPFIKPDLFFTILDPLRPGDELRYFPSLWNVENADVLVIGKTDEAKPEGIAAVRANTHPLNPMARVVEGRSPVDVPDAAALRGKRVLVVEDGPTVTHGGMGYGAGLVAVRGTGVKEIVDPRPYAQGQIADAFKKYPHLHDVLPALGYGDAEVRDLETTIRRIPCDVVVIGTPIDLSRVLKIDKPVVRVNYRYEDASTPGVADIVRERFGALGRTTR
ncbi:MAG: GTPase [Planctomycetes bacterium]|nr:GTPase [Planctomycetota bacterium]